MDTKRIEKAARAAFRETALLIHREAIAVISEPGAFDGFPQDLVDTGNLRASQMPPEINGDTATLRNTADYALYLHEGFELRAGASWNVRSHERKIRQAFGRPIEQRQVTVQAHSRTRQESSTVEGRPWMKLAIERVDVVPTFEKLLKAKLK